MAGEIRRVQTKDGTNHLIDYRYLANRPDIAGIEARITAILTALEDAGIHVDVSSGASVDGTRLTLTGSAYSVTDGKLSVGGASVDGTKLTF